MPPGGLAFDVGAHVGDRTDAFLALGARVVALEPQPDLARRLQHRYRRVSNVTVLPVGVGEHDGTTTLHLCPENPTLATTSEGWVRTAAATPGFDRYAFSRRMEIEVVTLETLIARFGVPDFVKIDVEGSEDAVLAGVSTRLPALSFEFLPQNRAVGMRALAETERLGTYRYTFSPGESLVLPDAWTDAEGIVRALERIPSDGQTGDVYARLVVH